MNEEHMGDAPLDPPEDWRARTAAEWRELAAWHRGEARWLRDAVADVEGNIIKAASHERCAERAECRAALLDRPFDDVRADEADRRYHEGVDDGR